MNCKPGDLAVIVRPGTTTLNLGKFVVVKHASLLSGWWWVESLSLVYVVGDDKPKISGLIEDARLRPIRDPGDDATDETLEWLPFPALETAP